MKLLIIPSWYPSNIHPESGTFFRERALLLQRCGFNITIAAHIVHSARDVLKFKPDLNNGMPISYNEMIVYKTEGFKLFTELLTRIRSDMLKSLFNVHIEGGQAPIPRQKSPKLVVDTTGKKIGRNESCPCGSGKKYKRCCG